LVVLLKIYIVHRVENYFTRDIPLLNQSKVQTNLRFQLTNNHDLYPSHPAMTSLGSILLTKALGSAQHIVASPIYTFTLQSSPQDANLTIITPTGYPKNASCSYSVATSESKKPHAVIYRGFQPDARNAIGSATSHSLSSTTDITLNGIAIRMRMGQMSGAFSFQCPQFGKLKWKPSQSGGSSMGLIDGSGRRLAQLKSSGVFGLGEKKLEILVPCDWVLTDLIVLSAMVAKARKKETDKQAGEILEAALGA
jgi:hypothetical protein